MTVGESIRALRAAAGLMQRELADRVGISASMLSLVEAGKREPSIGVLRAVGRALDIPTSVLFALALDDLSVAEGTKAARKTHELTRHLFEAARHSLTVNRIRNARGKSNRRIARRSA